MTNITGIIAVITSFNFSFTHLQRTLQHFVFILFFTVDLEKTLYFKIKENIQGMVVFQQSFIRHEEAWREILQTSSKAGTVLGPTANPNLIYPIIKTTIFHLSWLKLLLVLSALACLYVFLAFSRSNFESALSNAYTWTQITKRKTWMWFSRLQFWVFLLYYVFFFLIPKDLVDLFSTF